MKEFLKKNWALVVMILIIAGFSIYTSQEEEVIGREDQCWLSVLDNNGKGFSFPVDFCVQLKNQCYHDFHDIPCQWIDDNTNASEGMCQCKMC